ncbi:MAG: tyrosine-type recombinase/integrase [Bacteroidetes bacterium]|nr:tyrosine-type recombinase/integrase [Bacteroidota bacterium]
MSAIEKTISEFLNHCRYEKNLSPKTIKFYGIDLHQFYTWLTENNYPLVITEIDKRPLKAYLHELSKWKPKTVKRKIATLKALFNYLEFEDMILVNPLRKIRIKIKEPLRLPKALDKSEAGQILRAAYKSIGKADKKKYGYLEKIRNTAIIELLFATGARVSEVANLHINDINLETGALTIRGKGNKERIIHVCNPGTLAILNNYALLFAGRIALSGGSFWINRINKKLSDQSIRMIVSNISREAELTKKITPHVFRHTFATLLLENDVDIKYIQSLLGHSSIMTTQIYTQVNREKQRMILSEKHPRHELAFELS